MSIPQFLTDVLESALDQGIGTPSDVLRHATPEELSRHLPREVWKQLITAALASPRTDARLVVDTVTIATICQHLPAPIVWACVAELGNRSLSKPLVAPPPGRADRPPGAPDPGRPGTDGGRAPMIAAPTGRKAQAASAAAAKAAAKKPRDDDDIEIDVADDRKPDAAPVDDEQLIDWAQAEEVAADAESAPAPRR